MKSSLRSSFFQAENHDFIEIKYSDDSGHARIAFDGGGYLSISGLSKQQVLRLLGQARDCLASWPERCVSCDETATGTMHDLEAQEDLPACEKHRTDDETLRGAA